MKTILTFILAIGLLCPAVALPGQPDTVTYTLTKSEAKALGLDEERQAKLEELNHEHTRDLRIANIVYKNHPIMLEAKTKTINENYKQKLETLLNPTELQALLSIR